MEERYSDLPGYQTPELVKAMRAHKSKSRKRRLIQEFYVDALQRTEADLKKAENDAKPSETD
jgi:hypothetical protein